MEYTTNLNLKKPDVNEYYNVEQNNENMDLIDEAVGELNKKTVHQVENLVSISSGSIGIEKVGRVVTLYTNGLQLTNAINTATIIGKVPNDLKPSNIVINVSIHSVGGKSYPCRVALTTNGEIKVEAYDWDGGYLSTNLWMTMSMVWMI